MQCCPMSGSGSRPHHQTERVPVQVEFFGSSSKRFTPRMVDELRTSSHHHDESSQEVSHIITNDEEGTIHSSFLLTTSYGGEVVSAFCAALHYRGRSVLSRGNKSTLPRLLTMLYPCESPKLGNPRSSTLCPSKTTLQLLASSN